MYLIILLFWVKQAIEPSHLSTQAQLLPFYKNALNEEFNLHKNNGINYSQAQI
jgi:hypothetical protein